jgi:hypothetical protein
VWRDAFEYHFAVSRLQQMKAFKMTRLPSNNGYFASLHSRLPNGDINISIAIE